MGYLEVLRPFLSTVQDLLVQADGYALAMRWQGNVSPVVLQTLEDYGGLSIAEEGEQALWFFFSADALSAAARIAVWARFNPQALRLQIFPARFQIEQNGGRNLIFDESVWQMNVPTPADFGIRVHASMRETVDVSPGLSISQTPPGQGYDPDFWFALDVDPRLPYQSPLAWYCILRPMGQPQDKNTFLGWREFFPQLEAMLQRNKFRFSLHDLHLMFPLDTLRQVKSCCRDYLGMVERLKNEAPEQYWPCVMAIVDRRGMTLNEDLPKKIDVAWENLIPDYPHMSMRNALMLGEEFMAHEVRFAPAQHLPEDWVSVSLRSDESNSNGLIPQLSPVTLVFGPHPPCFYCGQRSHASADCPSRSLDAAEPSVWPRIARFDFTAMRAAVRQIDAHLETLPEGEARRIAILDAFKEEGEPVVMLKAFYDLIWPVQLRAVNFFWRARNKDLQKAAKNLAAMDNNPIWELLESFRTLEPQVLDKELHNLSIKYSKDFRVYSLRGFLAMEHGDLEKAEHYWKEAERASTHPIVQAWHVFLQARALECRGSYALAVALYDQLSRSCPTWYDADYRRAVCLVKNGFSEQAVAVITALIDKSGHFFNKVLIDPELERGYIQVLACLNGLWTSMEIRAREEEGRLIRMRDELATWFMPENPFAGSIAERIQKLLTRATIKNYVVFQMIVTGRSQVERDIQSHVLEEAREFKNRFRAYNSRLRVIHDESAWFPFPKALVEFNKNYNESAANINWALTANFHSPETFRKAQHLVEQEQERLDKLESRLRFLRIVRDSTLFVLSMMQTFLWLEILGIVLIFMLLPLLLYYGDKIGLDMAVGVLSTERWQVQKALFLVLTVVALGLAGLRTLLRFERVRDNILAKGKAGTVRKKKN